MTVSVIGVGTWQFGGEWGRRFSQREVDAILDRAAEEGINLIDTAECYGYHLSEQLIGDYLARRERDHWIVATKFGHRFRGFMDREERFGPDEVREQLEASLAALRTDRIDLYQFHSGSDEAFLDDRVRDVLEEARKAGRVRHLGVSVRSAGSSIQTRGAASLRYGVLQIVYNRIDRRAESEVFPFARRQGLGVLARVPLASGFLGGRYGLADRFAESDCRSTMRRQEIARRIREAERFAEVEVPEGVPQARWALAWCLRDPIVTAVIPGAKSPEQVADNAVAADLLSNAP